MNLASPHGSARSRLRSSPGGEATTARGSCLPEKPMAELMCIESTLVMVQTRRACVNSALSSRYRREPLHPVHRAETKTTINSLSLR